MHPKNTQAGSERQSKSGAKGARLKEAASINKSLSALGNVILALVTGSAHIPYRSSILTRLLRDCLGGTASTMLICNISPAESNLSESLSSLRFATRVKTVKNEANVVNRSALEMGASGAIQLQQRNAELEDEVQRLRRQVKALQRELDEERASSRFEEVSLSEKLK